MNAWDGRTDKMGSFHALALSGLQDRCPGTVTWFGTFTGSWWAYLPISEGQLLEAASAEELAHAIRGLWAINPWQR